MGFFGRRESLSLSVCLSVCLPNARLPEIDPTITRAALSSPVVPLESNLTIVASIINIQTAEPHLEFFSVKRN